MVNADAVAAAPSMSHVRAVSESARDTLAESLRRSPTVARLIDQLQQSDVIVFIDTRLDPSVPTAETMLMSTGGGVRYVHVILNPRMSPDDRVEYLAHELQHAVEIAEDRSAVDGPSVRRRFAEIGRALAGAAAREQAFETDEARRVSLTVRSELAAIRLGSALL